MEDKSHRGPDSRGKVLITSTGFHGAEKQAVIMYTQQLGALYHGDLVCGSTTHLVCKSVLGAVNTAKYLKALEWGVQVVSAQWLVDSVAAHKLLPCTSYKTDPWHIPVLAACPSAPHTVTAHSGKENHSPMQIDVTAAKELPQQRQRQQATPCTAMRPLQEQLHRKENHSSMQIDVQVTAAKEQPQQLQQQKATPCTGTPPLHQHCHQPHPEDQHTQLQQRHQHLQDQLQQRHQPLQDQLQQRHQHPQDQHCHQHPQDQHCRQHPQEQHITQLQQGQQHGALLPPGSCAAGTGGPEALSARKPVARGSEAGGDHQVLVMHDQVYTSAARAPAHLPPPQQEFSFGTTLQLHQHSHRHHQPQQQRYPQPQTHLWAPQQQHHHQQQPEAAMYERGLGDSSLSMWLYDSMQAPPPEAPATPRLTPCPSPKPLPQAQAHPEPLPHTPQPLHHAQCTTPASTVGGTVSHHANSARGLANAQHSASCGASDLDLSEMGGHMRMRAAPAQALGQSPAGGGWKVGCGGMHSPIGGSLLEQAIAKDQGAAAAGASIPPSVPPSIPPSPSDGWNAEDLIIPGTQAEFGDEDDLMSTPTSLVTYLRRKEEAAAAAACANAAPVSAAFGVAASANPASSNPASTNPAAISPAVHGIAAAAFANPAFLNPAAANPASVPPALHSTAAAASALNAPGHKEVGDLGQGDAADHEQRRLADHEQRRLADQGQAEVARMQAEGDMMVLSPDRMCNRRHSCGSQGLEGSEMAEPGCEDAGMGSPGNRSPYQIRSGSREGGLFGGHGSDDGNSNEGHLAGAGSPMAVSPLHPSARQRGAEEEGREERGGEDAMATSPQPRLFPQHACRQDEQGCGRPEAQQPLSLIQCLPGPSRLPGSADSAQLHPGPPCTSPLPAYPSSCKQDMSPPAAAATATAAAAAARPPMISAGLNGQGQGLLGGANHRRAAAARGSERTRGDGLVLYAAGTAAAAGAEAAATATGALQNTSGHTHKASPQGTSSTSTTSSAGPQGVSSGGSQYPPSASHVTVRRSRAAGTAGTACAAAGTAGTAHAAAGKAEGVGDEEMLGGEQPGSVGVALEDAAGGAVDEGYAGLEDAEMMMGAREVSLGMAGGSVRDGFAGGASPMEEGQDFGGEGLEGAVVREGDGSSGGASNAPWVPWEISSGGTTAMTKCKGGGSIGGVGGGDAGVDAGRGGVDGGAGGACERSVVVCEGCPKSEGAQSSVGGGHYSSSTSSGPSTGHRDIKEEAPSQHLVARAGVAIGEHAPAVRVVHASVDRTRNLRLLPRSQQQPQPQMHPQVQHHHQHQRLMQQQQQQQQDYHLHSPEPRNAQSPPPSLPTASRVHALEEAPTLARPLIDPTSSPQLLGFGSQIGLCGSSQQGDDHTGVQHAHAQGDNVTGVQHAHHAHGYDHTGAQPPHSQGNDHTSVQYARSQGESHKGAQQAKRCHGAAPPEAEGMEVCLREGPPARGLQHGSRGASMRSLHEACSGGAGMRSLQEVCLHGEPPSRGVQHEACCKVGMESRQDERDVRQAGGVPVARVLEAHQLHSVGGSREVEPGQELCEVMELLAQQQQWLQQHRHQQPLEVSVLKGMKGAPRGTTAKEWQRLSTLRPLTFAELVEVQVQQRYTFDSRLLCVLTEPSTSPL
ncbi:hypothetical protein DUNSADRAFT_5411 [Dunaliella salina]|uniref:BRCT domain-containing protein n=1 Tax=Dunaliella salina TaxID=3046 RepID=A0ABQ7GQ92_DUNSA|nr:hypothetical protein DUNSADRAFT_5411 [Dunaliella salina]|eukprot:KAF5836784.1 hypothetical protein DUNSADRAFT_5411 [Dunaliella salina]